MALDPTLRDALSAVTTASLVRALARRGVPACALSNVAGSGRAVGPAVTLRMIPARGAAMRSLADAIEAVPEGAVVVVDTGRSGLALPFGAILAARLAARGAAGLVTDGALAAESGLAVWDAAAATAEGALQLAGAGEPVACAGAAVHPGDIVVGGPDGVVVIPADIAEAVALEAVEQQRLDLWLTREAEKGTSLSALLPPDAATLARFEAETKA